MIVPSKNYLSLISLVFLLCYSGISAAKTGISVAYGRGTKNVMAFRLNLQRTWEKPAITYNDNKINGYWELAFTQINGRRRFPYHTNRSLQATTAAIAIRLDNLSQLPFFIDLGVGLSYVSKQEVSNRDLGSNLVFEERIGIGILFGARKQLECSYRFVHFSNAYLAQVNNGLNLQLLLLGYWFN